MILACVNCKKPFESGDKRRKRCDECRVKHNREKQKEFAIRHGFNERVKENGRRLNRPTAESIAWPANENPILCLLMRIAVPFDRRLSKNVAHHVGRGGVVYTPADVRALKEALILRFKVALEGKRWPHRKIWLDILVQKPDHGSDAINVLDTIADSAKVALGVDDRWFSIRKLDWQIVKENPMVFIGFGVDGLEDQTNCNACGRVLPLEAFKKGATVYSPKMTRVCRKCRSVRLVVKKSAS